MVRIKRLLSNAVSNVPVMLGLLGIEWMKSSMVTLERCVKLWIYICIIYTPNLGFGVAVLDREREQSRFRGSNEGAEGSSEGARGSKGRAC